MPRLLLLRHAKSDWSDAGLADHDRPLAERGRLAAPLIGFHVREQGFIPDEVLCSTALRARETLGLVLDAMEARPPVTLRREIYGAGLQTLLELVGEAAYSAECLLLVGHNPAFHEFAVALAGKGKKKLREKMAQKFPTAALAVIEFDEPWPRIGWSRGTLTAFVKPKELDG